MSESDPQPDEAGLDKCGPQHALPGNGRARNTHLAKQTQKQLADVLGGERLSERPDIDQLPYITTIVKEIFRWSPLVPIGATHRSMEDDVYNEMFIPSGTTLLENIWLVHLFQLRPDGS